MLRACGPSVVSFGRWAARAPRSAVRYLPPSARPAARQAATFASDDHVDVEVRQQLATMLFDNAEMRKQLNAYTEGILMQTMERLDQLGINDGKGDDGGMAGFLKAGDKADEKALLKQRLDAQAI